MLVLSGSAMHLSLYRYIEYWALSQLRIKTLTSDTQARGIQSKNIRSLDAEPPVEGVPSHKNVGFRGAEPPDI